MKKNTIQERISHVFSHYGIEMKPRTVSNQADLPLASVYIVRSGRFIKVGVAKDVQRRIGMMQIGNPVEIVLLKSIPHLEPYELEESIHSDLERYHVRGEWFDVPDSVLQSLLQSLP